MVALFLLNSLFVDLLVYLIVYELCDKSRLFEYQAVPSASDDAETTFDISFIVTPFDSLLVHPVKLSVERVDSLKFLGDSTHFEELLNGNIRLCLWEVDKHVNARIRGFRQTEETFEILQP